MIGLPKRSHSPYMLEELSTKPVLENEIDSRGLPRRQQ